VTALERIPAHTHSPTPRVIGAVWQGHLGWWASPIWVGLKPEVFPTRGAAVDYLKEVA